MSWFVSRCSFRTDAPIGFEKLGHPQFYSNFSVGENSGSPVAMIMTAETEVGEIAEGVDLDSYKGDFVNGLLDSSESYGEILSSTDFAKVLASARASS